MAVKKRGLGRGLDALLGSSMVKPAADQADGQQTENILHSIDLDQIQPGKYQPRQDMDQTSLEELAHSIKAQGVMQPIVLRSIQSGKYEVTAGERR